MASSLPLFLSLITECAAGFIMLTYAQFAVQKLWPIGRFYRSNLSTLLGGLSIIGTIGFAFVNLSFLYSIGVFIFGFLTAFILTFISKTYVQWIAFVLLIASLILQITYF